MRTWGRFGALVAITTALVACSPSDPRVTIVDGWSIGPILDCQAGVTCESYIDVATGALASREPWHPAIVSASVHQEGFYPCEQGGGISQIFRSGGFPPIVLFVLADGSRRAFGIDFTGPQFSVLVAEGHGPEVAPWTCDNGPHPTQHPTEVAAPA